MTTSTKAILIAIAIVLFPILMVLAFVYIPFGTETPEELQAQFDETYQQGQTFGKTTNEAGCFAEAVALTKNRRLHVMTGEPWLYGCLYASEISPGFCDGIPPPRDEPDRARQKAACAERKIDQYCYYFMPVVESFCHRKD